MSEPHDEGSGSLTEKAILTDVTKCIGCERCVEACVRQNDLPREIPTRFRADDGLSSRRYTSIVRIPGKEEGTWRNVRRQCMHCREAACETACLVGAFTKSPDGAVEYDADKCIGCRYCMLACPFMIPRYEYDQVLPFVRKCKMNEDCRVEGGQPACVAACPTGATVFGPRGKLLEEAKRRIAEKPDLYQDHVYGEHEFGGTSVIYLSDVPLNDAIRMPTAEAMEKARVPQLVKESIPHLLHGWVMVTPVQFVTVGLGLAGGWFLRRRQRLMAERARNERGAAEAGDGGAGDKPRGGGD
ncbi:MAG TPA: 4Fe-4S dicluster domain-containing protein [bacterium]|nr:4Fe-4S dicluster domain-containing protein [bacterium]